MKKLIIVLTLLMAITIFSTTVDAGWSRGKITELRYNPGHPEWGPMVTMEDGYIFYVFPDNDPQGTFTRLVVGAYLMEKNVVAYYLVNEDGSTTFNQIVFQ